MIIDSVAAWRRADAVRQCLPDRPCTARGVYLVSPEGFSLAEQSAQDNRYMAMQASVSSERALAQHRALQRALASERPALAFAGDPQTPDAVFPNNAFGTAPGVLVLGHMRHAVRQRETERRDIRGFFSEVLGYAIRDLREQPGICELTGSLVIDRSRGIGYCGLSERCDAAGAAAMHQAFDLRASFVFELARGEYHTNVVMSVLAGRAVVLCPDGFADAAVVEAIAADFAPHVVLLSAAEKQAFAGNCIAISESSVWMSEAAADGLEPTSRLAFERAGFTIRSVALDEIEKAGGSLRCCVGEIF